MTLRLALAVCFPAIACAQIAGPVILQNGVVPLYSASPVIAPGEWVSIYGYNLAIETTSWNGDFPRSLGGTTVAINGKPAYLWYVSPGQINLQAPDDTATGTVPVAVTTPDGTALSLVTLSRFAPSFSLLDNAHVAGIIIRADKSGAYGSGAYDILGPAGSSLGYFTTAAKAGDKVELFGVGFGPTTPFVPAGAAFTGAAATTSPVSLLLNQIPITPTFAGMSSAGLYQINFTVPPNAGAGDVPLQAAVGGVQTSPGTLLSLQALPNTTQVQSLSFSVNSISGGSAVTGTVTLSASVASGTAIVKLSSSSPNLTIPATVTVAAGASSATFVAVAGALTATQVVTVTASYGGTTAQAMLSATPPAVPSFSAMTISGTWPLSPYQISVSWTLQPDPGASTYTANGGNLFPTFLNCSALNGSTTIRCGTVAPFPQNLLVTPVGIFLNVATGSLVFTVTSNSPVSNAGNFTGTLSVSGTSSSGAAQSYSGPITGHYALTP